MAQISRAIGANKTKDAAVASSAMKVGDVMGYINDAKPTQAESNL
jgi:hypothetical protein